MNQPGAGARMRGHGVLLMACLALPLVAHAAAEPPDGNDELEPIVVQGQRVAILEPANTYAEMSTALRYDPGVRLQTRGLPEGQSDVTVRGGLFENTGFRVGAITVIDPQTGHYAVEFPLDPAMLTQPAVLTDGEHALLGFNASVATLQYGIRPVTDGGSVAIGAGSDELRFGSLRAGRSMQLDDGRRLGIGAAAAASRGDGTRPFGDHDFERYTAQLSLEDAGSATHLLAGYQDKFYGWPGAYTGFATLPETDRTRLSLMLADHRRDSARGWWELTAAWRRLEDDYDFDRRTVESGVPGSFEHETRATMIGLGGEQRWGGLDWRFNAQFTADRLVRSTDLTGGEFSTRSYVAAGLAPVLHWDLSQGRRLQLVPGLRVDWGNRDEDALLPMIGIEYEQAAANAATRVAFDYARTSQLPGYTALKSPPRGLFGGNPALEREYADTFTARVEREQGDLVLRAAVFHRSDDDLVDWTYFRGAPSLRQANPVDIDVLGADATLEWSPGSFWVLAGYAWLDKDADYGSATVDASYYALNFARHRATLALVWRPVRQFELRVDNEYRLHEENPLRRTSRRAFLAAIAAAWRPSFAAGAEIVLAADNLADDDFQEFPGTPAYGRTWSLALRYGW